MAKVKPTASNMQILYYWAVYTASYSGLNLTQQVYLILTIYYILKYILQNRLSTKLAFDVDKILQKNDFDPDWLKENL